jgi:hypothetical protein
MPGISHLTHPNSWVCDGTYFEFAGWFGSIRQGQPVMNTAPLGHVNYVDLAGRVGQGVMFEKRNQQAGESEA